MDGPRRSGPAPADPAGASPLWRPSLGYIVLALAIVAGAVVYALMPAPQPAPLAAPTAAATQRGEPPATNGLPASAPVAVAASGPMPAAPTPTAAPALGAASGAPQRIARTRDPNGDLTPDIADFVNQGEKPTMREVIERLHQAGVHSGLGAFSPPGTRPPLVGLAVPEDFVLPEGYVRHYQATDDGQRIEPILMFAPDRAFFDSAGRPIAIPADRVVPPEMAPPGLPIRRIVIPAPAEAGRPGS